MAIVIITTLIITSTSIRKENNISNTIQKETTYVYVGSKLYGELSSKDISNVSMQLINSLNLANTRIIMFGLTTCPHCHNMDKFFKEYYSNMYAVFWVDVDNKAEKIFIEIVKIEINNNIPRNLALSVPHTLVIVNSKVKAIVIGEIQSTEFWNNILKN